MRADSRDARGEHWRTGCHGLLLLLLRHTCSGCRVHWDRLLHMLHKRHGLCHRERVALRKRAARHDKGRAGLRQSWNGLLDNLRCGLRRHLLRKSQRTCQREARSCCM